MSRIPTLADLGDVSGKRVLVRTDFNVPLETRSDHRRLPHPRRPADHRLAHRARRARSCHASHLGRPKGQPNPKYSMDAGAGPPGRARARCRAAREPALRPGRGGQRSGVRRHARRGHRRLRRRCVRCVPPRPRLDRRSAARRCRRRWACCCRRRSRCCSACATTRSDPFVAVLGGAKISDKLGVVEALLRGRRFAGHRRGDVLHVPRRAGQSDRRFAVRARPGRHVPATARRVGGQRQDHPPAARTSSASTPPATSPRSALRLPDGAKGFDIGPGTAAAFSDVIMDARTVFWNGPMGMFEDPRFAAGTRTVAQAMADTKAFTVVGGGDSAAALAQFRLDDEVDHVSHRRRRVARTARARRSARARSTARGTQCVGR